MAEIRGADLLVDTLVKAGVKVIFGCSGDSVLSLFDALYGRSDIRYIGVRHEQCAVHMADGYARASGRPGAFFTHVGPGAMNTPIAVAAAYKDDVPVLGLICQQEQHKLGRDIFHELDQLSVLKPICKWTWRISRPQDMAHYTMEGLNVAMSGRRGPVVLEVPKDALRDKVPVEDVTISNDFVGLKAYRPRPDATGVQAAVDLILSAKRPALMAGAGIHFAGAWAELAETVRLLGCAVVTTGSGRTALPEDHPLCAGFPGTFGMVTAGKMLRSADVILGIGTKFSDNCTAEWKLIDKQAQIIHVDIDPTILGKQLPPAVAIMADARAFLLDFNAALRAAGRTPKSDAELAATAPAREIKASFAEERGTFFAPGADSAGGIQPQYIIQQSAQTLPRDVSLITGSGAHRMYADRIPLYAPNSYFKSVNLGAMGFALPAAMGVKLARPDQPVVCVAGDGEYMMTMQDLETAVRENIAITVVILNNQGFQSTKYFQKKYFQGRTIGQDFGNPDFAVVARAFGALGFRVDRLEQYVPALKEAMASGRPAVIDVHTDPDAAPFEIMGFAQQMKALIGVK